jgi:hypothetical protein
VPAVGGVAIGPFDAGPPSDAGQGKGDGGAGNGDGGAHGDAATFGGDGGDAGIVDAGDGVCIPFSFSFPTSCNNGVDTCEAGAPCLLAGGICLTPAQAACICTTYPCQ